MWDTVGVIASVVVIVLLIQVLDVAEVFKQRLRGKMSRPDIEARVARLEERMDEDDRMKGRM
jgi:hypothetical protein